MIYGKKKAVSKIFLYIISEEYFVAHPADSQKLGHKNIVSKVFWTVAEDGTFLSSCIIYETPYIKFVKFVRNMPSEVIIIYSKASLWRLSTGSVDLNS